MSTEPHRIDVHHHIVPPRYLKALASIGITSSGGRSFPEWTPESMFAVMDEHGIDTAMTSITSPGVYFGDAASARDLARRCNDISARLLSDYGKRVGAFAVLPLPDVDGALNELEYALDTLGLDGVGLLASVGDQYLGDPAFDALFAELNRRKTVVFIHPNIPPGSNVPKLDLPPFIVEFVFDTTRAVTNLIYSGTLERYQDIRFIVSHAGGAAPYLAWRIWVGGFPLPDVHKNAPEGAITYLQRLYYDTALSASPYALRSLQELIDSSHMLFGSDYPFAPEIVTTETIRGLEDYDGFDAQTRMAVERENALKLFPRLRDI